MDCVFEPAAISTARWVSCPDEKKFRDFREKNELRIAADHQGALVYLASSPVNLAMTRERFPDIAFDDTREHSPTS